MNSKLATGCFILAALISPIAVHAEDGDSDRAHPAAFVKDSIITTKIKANLADEKMKTLVHVHVDTDAHGMVVLSGSVHTHAQAERAVEIAKATEGVTSVTSHIRVKAGD